MSYYDNQQWPAAAGQPTWDNQTPPARSGASSAVPREDSTAFSSQLEEVDRAIENLFKSGKVFNVPARRESMPMGAPRTFPEQYGAGPRHHSVSDFGGDARTYSASNLQNFYATQRHQPSRASEAEQVMQAKRRMAAQRERELRNYHQEQQYNRSVLAELSSFGGKPDRTMSPGSAMSEEERRDLIARQRSALYGEPGAYPEGTFVDENGVTRQSAPSTTGGRGHSPLAFEGTAASSAAAAKQPADAPQTQTDDQTRANSTSSPSSNSAGFQVFDAVAQQSSRTSTSSPGGSPPRQGKPAAGTGVAPIGTRPAGQQAANPALSKRSTTPLPSPLSYGFAASEEGNGKAAGGAGAATATSTPAGSAQDVGLGGWGSKSGVWGKNALGVQASVWG